LCTDFEWFERSETRTKNAQIRAWNEFEFVYHASCGVSCGSNQGNYGTDENEYCGVTELKQIWYYTGDSGC
jgi:hypothetical protein